MNADDLEGRLRRYGATLDAAAAPDAKLDTASSPVCTAAQPGTGGRPGRRHGKFAAAGLVTAAALVGVVAVTRTDSPALRTTPPSPTVDHTVTPITTTAEPPATAADTVTTVTSVTTESSSPTTDADTTTTNDTTTTTAETTTTTPERQISVVLQEPGGADVARDTFRYEPHSGQTEVTAAGNYVELRLCTRGLEFDTRLDPRYDPCPEWGWAYATGNIADPLAVHHGFFWSGSPPEASSSPPPDALVLSPIDDRHFVASPVPEGDQPVPPVAWLIDSETGRLGELRWSDEPATLSSPNQSLALYPAHAVIPFVSQNLPAPPEGHFVGFEDTAFLPRVVDTVEGTIRPLAVPGDAWARLRIAQSGVGRVWIGTNSAGDVGLAYTDDGGASWTRVEPPEEALVEALPEDSAGFVFVREFSVVASGDQVAMAPSDFTRDPQIYMSDNAGITWRGVFVSSELCCTELFLLRDRRLVVTLSPDYYLVEILVSSSASDWSQLEDATPDFDGAKRLRLGVNQTGVAMLKHNPAEQWVMTLSTDLVEWSTMPGA